MNKKKGVSLLILVVSILVMLILAGVVIVSIGEENPITNAGKATFVTDLGNLKEQLKIMITNKISNKEISQPADVNLTAYADIIEYVPDFPKKYEGKIIIQEGRLVVDYDKLNSQEKALVNEFQIEKIQTAESARLPKGFSYVTSLTGETVIEDNITKSRFVWIPVDNLNNFVQVDFNKGVPVAENLIDDTEPAILDSIEKYGGFYIASFELGIENGKGVSKPGIRVLKSNGEGVKLQAERMYNTNSVRSVVPTGRMYDAMLKFIDTVKDVDNSASWGRYLSESELNNYYTQENSTTGARNIYDVAGGYLELTSETYGAKNIYRSGSSHNNVAVRDPGNRLAEDIKVQGYLTVRPALILK